jgi:hypothetical protein
MNKDDLIQAAREEWESLDSEFIPDKELFNWHWFWLILAVVIFE